MKNKSEERKQRLSDAIDDKSKLGTLSDRNKYPMASETVNFPKIKGKSYEEIAFTRRIDIPQCKKIPINGRIFAIETAGTESKTESGIIVPHKYRTKKGEETEIRDVSRYFVVKWDKLGIPFDISGLLCEGIEISIFMPIDAEDYKPAIIVDFETSNQFLVFHYTELAGISETIPQIVEK